MKTKIFYQKLNKMGDCLTMTLTDVGLLSIFLGENMPNANKLNL